MTLGDRSRFNRKCYRITLQGSLDNYFPIEQEVREISNIQDADLISSEIENGLHAPALDIDWDVWAVPSRTLGHWHVYIDVPMTWRQYKRVLKALAKAGVVQWGWYKAARRDRATYLRVGDKGRNATS